MRILTVLSTSVMLCGVAMFGQTKVAATPPMGWNSWNHFAVRVTDADVRSAADMIVSTGMRDAAQQQAVCAVIWEKLGEPDFADIREALLRHPSAMSTMFNPLVQMLARRPGEWPNLAMLIRWWLGEVAHGRRPGALRRLTARFGNRPFAKATSI